MTQTGWEWHSVATSGDVALVERARRVIPGGSLTRSKKVFQRYARSAEGCTITDTDGRTYIDMLCGLGAISLGYRPHDALALAYGVCSLPYSLEIDAAEAVLRDVCPWGRWVRFTKTGSESCHAAYRIAKARHPRREAIYRLDGSYHGWHEWCDTPGYTVPLADNGFPDRDPYDVAAILVEPRRFGPTSAEWLRALRAWCDWSGALLVFDSMIWGGRFALGGASEFYGVIPDLECYGKSFGNGAAISFVVGKDDTRAFGEIPSGTFSGELSGLAALMHTLDVYRTEPVIETMRARGEQLMTGLRAVIPPDMGIVEGHPHVMRVRFPLANIPGWNRVDEAKAQQFSDAMLARGVIWHPVVALTMLAHTEAHIDQVIAAAREAVETL